MANENKIYKVEFDENESYTKRISFVQDPAIVSGFLHFSTVTNFTISNERMEVLGAAMIPDIVIPRGTMGSVVFTKEDIRKNAQKFMRDGMQHELNIDHTEADAGSYVFQSYIVDSEKGVQSPKGLDLPDGSWVIGSKVDNTDLWNDIVSGKVRGFSIELSGMKTTDVSDKVDVEETPNNELDKVYAKLKHYTSIYTTK